MQFLISTLAEYQTVFWRDVGVMLRDRGHGVSFLSFDDRSTAMLRAVDLEVFTIADGSPSTETESGLDEQFAAYGIQNVNFWLTHERFAFGLRDADAMQRKLATSLRMADRAIADIAARGTGTPLVVQELGGFLSVVGTFFAAQRRGVAHWFIEPSFFRGHLYYLRDTFAAKRVEPSDHIDPAMDVYLRATLESGSIVIPQKDRHQYTSARRKIVNMRNAKRLAQKMVDKYVLGKRQEFGHIGSHVSTHAKMLVNSRRLSGEYGELDTAKPFVYYPLHVPGDMALTLRSPTYLDQTALIDFICRSVPLTHHVVIKEHPAMVGAFDARSLIALKRRYDHLVVLHPTTNNYAVMREADAVVTVNSKSGAEAGLLGKQVVVLGDAFYRDAPFAVSVDRLQDLPTALSDVLKPQAMRHVPDSAAAHRFFAGAWSSSYEGELYVATPANVDRFTSAMIEAVS